MILEKIIITELAKGRGDAMSECESLGKQFIKHFNKIYNNPDDINIHHWETEMATWLNKVSHILMKQTNKYILMGEIRDWFFTAGEYYDSIITDATVDEIIAYDDFESYLTSIVQQKRKESEFTIMDEDIDNALKLSGVLG